MDLKDKAIKAFQKFLKRLEIGYVDDYSDIMDMILYIQTHYYVEYPDKVYGFLINK